MTDFPEHQHWYKTYREFREDGTRYLLHAEAGLHYLQGNARPYFTVTGEQWTLGRHRRLVSAGAMHDLIARAFPKLQPIIALHLSDDRGEPMHAEPNGWYWLAGYYGGAGERYHGGNGKRQHWKPAGPEHAKVFDGYRDSTPEECLATFAEHVRITVDDARRLAELWRWTEAETHRTYRLGTEIRAAYAAWLETQRPRWQAEADAALALLDGWKAAQLARAQREGFTV